MRISGWSSDVCSSDLAHAIPVEQSIVRRAGAGFGVTATLRIGTAIAYGAAVSWVCYLTGTLADPLSFEWLRGSSFLPESQTAGYIGWIQATAFSLLLTFVIIAGLVLVLDGMDRLGITRLLTAAMMPPLKVAGLRSQFHPVTTGG